MLFEYQKQLLKPSERYHFIANARIMSEITGDESAATYIAFCSTYLRLLIQFVNNESVANITLEAEEEFKDAKDTFVRLSVLKLLKEYGYEANPLAKALNYQNRKMKVEVVLPQVQAAIRIRQGINIVIQDFQSFNIQVEYHEVGSSDAEAQAACIRRMAEERVSGAVILPIRSQEVTDAIRSLIDLDIPVVLVNSEPSVEGILCYVGQNTVQSGSVAARMLSLFMNGSSRIGIISCHNMITHEQREQSFISNVNDFFPGFSIRDIRYILETPENAREQTLEMLRSHPEIDSVFITCGCVPEICAALREYREETGSEIRPVVICYEKYEEIRALLKTGDISCTLSGGLFMQGRLSMRILFEYLVYEKVPEHKAYYLNNKIMIRENS